ncbi:DUF4386 domain-containing protein [Nostoc sp. FACHB-152]|uniref:DUF4386 domain-containing protein n=1 Tax=unclassified Nostoc TaxID=2593658 RepID=UPI001685479F|nr:MULTISPECIES: DUF4386 domain-containing protein [unclassified Nostoc]MBD2452126.1 DUF4386 domain-containing protein [Nostoc sp. FACHB-152]MBD2472745.1 DUF4386 domain-containing protein [Nostoc sp. FACHB-145]
MNYLRLVKITGIIFILLVLLLNVPYILLIQNFEYDDILRESVDYVLQKFQTGGAGLILTWFTFGFAALLFVPASILLHQIMEREDTPYLKTATCMGVLSGILQSVGLMRWVFVVPILANLYTSSTASSATQEAVSVVYQVVHQYGGVVIGEYLGQTLLVFWTLGVGVAMLHSSLFKSWIAYFGLMTVPLLILGHSELFATAMPSLPVLELTPIGFILWEVWIFMIGISLLRVPPHRVFMN